MGAESSPEFSRGLTGKSRFFPAKTGHLASECCQRMTVSENASPIKGKFFMEFIRI